MFTKETVKLTGRVAKVNPIVSKGNYEKRTLIIYQDSKDAFGRPVSEYRTFDVEGEVLMQKLSDLRVGDEVEVEVALSGVSYSKDGEQKYFNKDFVIGFTLLNKSDAPAPATAPAPASADTATETTDLPF